LKGIAFCFMFSGMNAKARIATMKSGPLRQGQQHFAVSFLALTLVLHVQPPRTAMPAVVLPAQYNPSNDLNGPPSIKDGSSGMDLFQDVMGDHDDQTLDDGPALQAQQAGQTQMLQQNFDRQQNQVIQTQEQMDQINQPAYEQQLEQQFNQQPKPLQ